MATVHINGASKALFVHLAIANAFLKKPSQKCKYVLHLDYNKENNSLDNLKWATKEEQVNHSKKVLLFWQQRLINYILAPLQKN